MRKEAGSSFKILVDNPAGNGLPVDLEQDKAILAAEIEIGHSHQLMGVGTMDETADLQGFCPVFAVACRFGLLPRSDVVNDFHGLSSQTLPRVGNVAADLADERVGAVETCLVADPGDE